MASEAREARISAVQFAIALGVALTGLVLFACALVLI